jgi:hypothetical protein
MYQDIVLILLVILITPILTIIAVLITLILSVDERLAPTRQPGAVWRRSSNLVRHIYQLHCHSPARLRPSVAADWHEDEEGQPQLTREGRWNHRW